MPRHILRSHLSIKGRSACGVGSQILKLKSFNLSSDRCVNCDRISQGLPIGRPKKSTAIRSVSLRISPEASEVCDRLASEGKLGEAVTVLVEWATSKFHWHVDLEPTLEKYWRNYND